MCGRYVTPDTAAIERAWQVSGGEFFPRRFNVAPTMTVPIVRKGEDGLRITEARWAFVPGWWKKPKPPAHAFNARAEDAATKSLWRDAYREARCLIPASGWYEWQAAERPDPETGEIQPYRQPHYIFRSDRRLVCFGGLMSLWRPAGEAARLTCAIITTPAAPSLLEIHERMPLVLPESTFEGWLDASLQQPADIAALVARAELEFERYPVSTRLNAAKNDDEQLVARLQ